MKEYTPQFLSEFVVEGDGEDRDLVHGPCGEWVTSVDDNDDMGVLASVCADHICGDSDAQGGIAVTLSSPEIPEISNAARQAYADTLAEFGPSGDLPSVPTFVVRDDALYEALTRDDIDHDTVREQTGEDA